MKFYFAIFLVLVTINYSFSQERKIKIAIKGSNIYMKCITTGRFFDLSTAGLGIDVKTKKSNMRFYGTYGYNVYIALKSDIGIGYADNFTLKSHFIGVNYENYFLDEDKRIRPYFGISFLSEVAPNYKNGYIGYKSFIPLKFNSPPMSTNDEAIYYGNHPYENMFGCAFYQITPLLFKLNGGFSLRIIDNLNLNFSLGYSLSVMNYKYVKWTKYDDRDEMIRKTPMQRKALHSIAGQVGLNYVFSFQKKSKTEVL